MTREFIKHCRRVGRDYPFTERRGWEDGGPVQGEGFAWAAGFIYFLILLTFAFLMSESTIDATLRFLSG